jgi:hypothetical protein
MFSTIVGQQVGGVEVALGVLSGSIYSPSVLFLNFKHTNLYFKKYTFGIITQCMISNRNRIVQKQQIILFIIFINYICALLGYYAVFSDTSVPTFRDNQ